jgi:hypothetical protein
MDELEDQVRLLSEQKAAIEASNEELKRQNKYWEELFAKQQLLPAAPLTTAASLHQPQSTQLSAHGGSENMQRNKSLPESQDLTRSSHELSHVEEGHLSDPSYENLEMTRADFMKRQKCSNDNDYYSN